ncbi:WD40/YVTN/BNR-like repeat-containing protein [Parathalassolituus penaei]|uniref:YCF48-related protein n=1 Tax=Parathalassolituus penaei TaxID=2997323 RepID=A0A9X3EGT5_9GAMM|nr:YCF48-related protein [Parathalassolituus penaei]MCY0967287.1 YCF48-related protein [Parathalassolituus penaei]
MVAKALNNKRSLLVCGLLLAAGIAVATVAEPPKAGLAEADQRPALASAQGQHAAVLDVAAAGKRLVAVGERGLIMLSDDQGQSWKQAQVPVSVSLTSVSFVDDQFGWAAGHYGMVLATRDGGQHWEVQLDGSRAARLVLDDVRSRADGSSDQRLLRAVGNAQRLVEDGPDKPFLDIYFSDRQNGLVVGAYGLIFATTDGGISWKPLNSQIDNPGERHLYSIASADHQLWLAGEEGLLFRADQQQPLQFERLSTPYDGSFFTVSAAAGRVVVAGLRGNAFESTDNGTNWETLSVPSEASIIASEVGSQGELLLVNQAGQLLSANAGQYDLQNLGNQPVMAPSSMVRLADGGLLLGSLQGLSRINSAALKGAATASAAGH